MNELSRRSFLKGAAASALGLGAASILQAAPVKAEEVPAYDWTDAADLVVVGGGGAGFCAAIEAARAGSTVLVLEKGDLCGGDTLLSGGMIMVGGTKAQKALGIEDTVENFVKTELGYVGEFADREMVQEMCEGSQEVEDFMVSLGRQFTSLSAMLPVWGYDTEETWAARTIHDRTSREGHFATLQREAAKYDGIKVRTATECAHLIQDETGAVIGVKDVNGKYYRANKGVVLSTASFGTNREMSKRYNQMNYWALSQEDAFGVQAPNTQCANNTGDGIRMAQEIGADLKLATSNCISDVCCMSFDSMYASILVNDLGHRFVQESAHWGYLNQMVFNEAVKRNQTDPKTCKFYLIADQATVEKNMYLNFLNTGVVVTGTELYMKRIIKADTIAELAEKAGLPVDALTATVDRWNTMAAAGEDTEFGRKDIFGQTHLQAMGEGPFYAFPYVPYSMGSFGGLRTDKETQVLDTKGNAIPRLYAAGAIMSGMYTAPFYNACGWSVLGTVHWGRKAGRNIAALEPWTTEEVIVKEEAVDNLEAAIANANGSYNAGTYDAVGKGRNGDVPVTVEFSDKAILSVSIGAHQETPGIGDAAVNGLPGRIVLAQSADVDVFSGATMTSDAILAAVRECIEKARK